MTSISGFRGIFHFARRLNCDSELRGDVLRVVKTVMDGEDIRFADSYDYGGGSGGPDVTASNRQMSVPVNLIIEALTVDDARWSSTPPIGRLLFGLKIEL